MKPIRCLAAVFAAIIFFSCSNNSVGVTEWAPASDEEYQSFKSTVESVFRAIPDHECVRPEARPYMTAELYEALRCAWEILDVDSEDGEIGESEFLYYFVSGNGGGVPSEDITVGTVLENGDSCREVRIAYNLVEDSYVYLPPCIISLKLVLVDGVWLLDDFGSGVKERCLEICGVN